MELFSLTTNVTITDVPWQAYPIGFVLLLLCLLTILGNTLIIYAIVRAKALHTSTHYYIASLAFADLLVGLIVMPLAFIFEMTDDEYWLFRRHLHALCDYWHAMDIFASTASIFGLCTIGLDRYMAITQPIAYPNTLLSKRWYYVLPMIWICSAILSFPPVIYFGTVKAITRKSSVHRHPHTAPFDLGQAVAANETIVPLSTSSTLLSKECEFPDNPYYILFMSVFTFYMPLLVMIYVYIQVYLAARKQLQALHSGFKRHSRVQSSKPSSSKLRLEPTSTDNRSTMETLSPSNTGVENDDDDEKSINLPASRRDSTASITLRIHYGRYQNPTSAGSTRKKNKPKKSLWTRFTKGQRAATFIGIIMGVFVICWLPYFVYSVLSGVFLIRLKDDQSHDLMFRVFSWLGYTNSALDVLVYVSTSNELRVTVLRLFTRRKSRRPQRAT